MIIFIHIHHDPQHQDQFVIARIICAMDAVMKIFVYYVTQYHHQGRF